MLGTAERRTEIIKLLCRRKKDTVSNLASEFGVSARTIRRDIEVLSLSEPIYTIAGKNGGVHITDGYSLYRMYMEDNELILLKKIRSLATAKSSCVLSNEEMDKLNQIISQYTKPTVQLKNNYK